MDKPQEPAYIAGPMSGMPELNYSAFGDAERWLVRKYWINVLSPHHNGETVKDKPYEYYFRRGVEQLLRCKSVVFLPGWLKSPGAVREYHIADGLNLEMWYLQPVIGDEVEHKLVPLDASVTAELGL